LPGNIIFLLESYRDSSYFSSILSNESIISDITLSLPMINYLLL